MASASPRPACIGARVSRPRPVHQWLAVCSFLFTSVLCVRGVIGVDLASDPLPAVRVWTPVAYSGDTFRPRCDHTSVIYNSKVYTFGGYSEAEGSFDDLFEFDPATSTMRAVPVTGATPIARSGHFGGLVGSLYVVAGGVNTDFELLDDIFYVDLASAEPLEWIQPTIANPQDKPVQRAWGTAVAVNSSTLFLFGGLGEKIYMFDSHFMDVTSWRWTRILYPCNGSDFDPVSVRDPVSLTFKSFTDDEIKEISTMSAELILGNTDSNCTALQSSVTTHNDLLISLAPANASDANAIAGLVSCSPLVLCPNITCPLPPPAEGVRSAMLNGTIYLYGGWKCAEFGSSDNIGGGPDCFSDDVYAFNVGDHTWKVLNVTGDESLESARKPPARAYATFQIVGDEAFVFGGFYRDLVRIDYFFNDLYILNLRTLVWRRVSAKGMTPGQRWSHTISFVNGTGYLIGGCKSPSTFYNTVDKLFGVTPDPSSSAANGLGISSPIVVGDFGNFRLSMVDRNAVHLTYGGGNVVAFGFERGGFAYFQGVVVDQQNGTYDVSFRSNKASDYLLSVQYEGRDIKGSPFNVTLKAGVPDVSLSHLRTDTALPVASVAVSVLVDIVDRYGNRADGSGLAIHANVTTPSGSQSTMVFSVVETGVLSSSFIPYVAGRHVVGVDVAGQRLTMAFDVQDAPRSSSNSNLVIYVSVPVAVVCGCLLVAAVGAFMYARRMAKLAAVYSAPVTLDLDGPVAKAIKVIEKIRTKKLNGQELANELNAVRDALLSDNMYQPVLDAATAQVKIGLESVEFLDDLMLTRLMPKSHRHGHGRHGRRDSMRAGSMRQLSVTNVSMAASSTGSMFFREGLPGSIEDNYDGHATNSVVSSLASVHRWDFNIFTLESATEGRPLCALTVEVFFRMGLMDAFLIDHGKLKRFLVAMEVGYHRHGAEYHTSTHAADVLQAMFVFLQNEQFASFFSPLEILAACLACVGHDLDHPGVTNNFLIATGDDLALLYSDTSVLENHHSAAFFQALQDPDANILEGLDHEEFRRARKLICSLILATDVAQHFEHLNKFKTRTASGQLLSATSDSDRLLLLVMAIKCADVSNPTKARDVYDKWTSRIMEEFFKQGDRERELGMPVSMFMD
eukprot:Opistho-2@33321